MSDYLPELERDLRAAIRSRARRSTQPAASRRRRLGAILALTVAALVALSVVAGAFVLRSNLRAPRAPAPRSASRPTTRPTAPARAVSIDRAFAAFRRPRAASDALTGLLPLGPNRLGVDASQSRLVFASPVVRLWLLPASGPYARVCLVQAQTLGSGGTGATSCHANPWLPFTASPVRIVTASRAAPRRHEPSRLSLGRTVFVVLTVHETGVRFTLTTGATTWLRPNANGAVVHTFRSAIQSVHFTR